ncbi:MAG TPA: hypothetical protein VM261_31655 [Kofleriaceae bacterium]|nr:hypothetical protein [Kofleriaceae bacterium]
MHETDERGGFSVDPGYALGQLARALTADAAETWRRVFAGMMSGALDIGSRTPAAAPAWATLEVAHGGFATGRLLAGGELQPHEHALLAQLGHPADDRARAALNAWFLGERGQADLRARLRDGTYRIGVPEEAALLVVTWLLDSGDADTARHILEQIGPYLGQLRFYPQPGEAALDDEARDLVCLQPVAVTVRQLDALREREARLVEREAVTVWAPLVDRMVAMFQETVDAEWPCQLYPPDWAERARALVAEVAARRAEPHRCGRRVDHPRQNLARLHALLTLAADEPRTLTGHQIGEVRGLLQRIDAKRGLAGSERLAQLRAGQRERVLRPTRVEWAKLLSARLARVPGDRGLPTLAGLMAQVSSDEATVRGLPAGAAPPDSLLPLVARSLEATVEQLVDAGVIGSAETLARVVPHLAGPVVAAGVRDPSLRRLYAALYQAFRRRRSLLLLWLQHQVRLSELPWAAAVSGARVDDAGTRVAARVALGRVVDVAICAWPETILPNKLLQEVRALAERAGAHLPIVDEIAADIFMGELSEKFLRAAQRASRFLAGTLYATYYDLPVARLATLDDVAPSRWGTRISPGLMSLCMARAGASSPFGSVAHNGTILEQSQILTTHNLAVLVGGLGLSPRVAAKLPALARRSWDDVVRSLQVPRPRRIHQLRAIKNAAYTWRQMIFFASIMPAAVRGDFIRWAGERMTELPDAFRARFGPAYAGLCLAAAGITPRAATAPEARVFLGWSTDPHWLLA